MIKKSFKLSFLVLLLLFMFSASLSAHPKSVLPDFIKEKMEHDISQLEPIDFDWNSAEWVNHDEVNAAEQAALLAEQEIENAKANQAPKFMPFNAAFETLSDVVDPPSMSWNPSIPYGGSNSSSANSYLPAMRKGLDLNMPQDAWDRFKTPSFWYGASGSGRIDSHIDADGNYVKGSHDPGSDEPGARAYITSNLENEMWFKELSERPDLQGENRRMQYQLITGVPHYQNSTNVNTYLLARTFNMIVAVFSKPSVFTPEEVRALGKPTVLLHAQIHGNENSPCEAQLQVARELAEGLHDDVLDKITVVMIPRVNPTGAWQNTRATFSIAHVGMAGQSAFDLNRDNLGWETPEIKLVRYIANQYNPLAGIDGHEQGGLYENQEQYRTATGTYTNNGYYRSLDAAISISTSNNININRDVRALGRYLYEPAMKEWLVESKIGGNWYRSGTSVSGIMSAATSYLETDVVSTNGTTGPVAGRLSWPGTQQDVTLTPGDQVIMNGIGLGNQSIHFCIEGSRMTSNSSPRIGLLRVVYGQYICNMSLLKTTAEHLDTITSVVGNARQLEIDNADTIAMWTQVPTVTANNDWFVTEFADWRKNDIPEVVNGIRAGSRPIREVRAFFSEKHPNQIVQRPSAYIIAPENYLAACRLYFTGLTTIERLAEDTLIDVEAYTVLTTGGANIASYASGNLPQMTAAIHSVAKANTTKLFPKNSFVLKMNSLGGVMTGLLLEPMGTVNLGNMFLNRQQTATPTWYRQNFLPVAIGQEYPAYRFMGSTDSLNTYPARLNLPFLLTVVERVHSPTQDKVEQIKADLGLASDPEYVSLFELPVLSSDVNYKKWSRVDVNEAFLLPDGSVINIEEDNIVNGNDWVEKSLSVGQTPPVVLIVAPKGLGGEGPVYLANKDGSYRAAYVPPPKLIAVTPYASVEKLNGNKNNLTVTVIEDYDNGEIEIFEKTFSIDNNAAGTYVVGPYKVYVDTKGNTQIRACYIVN